MHIYIRVLYRQCNIALNSVMNKPLNKLQQIKLMATKVVELIQHSFNILLCTYE